MFLVFPQSIIIPEILEHLEDTDFEDWLTATLIESANQQLSRDAGSNGAHSSPGGIADLWMLEIAGRDGNVWKGKFQVEFTEENGESSEDARLVGQEPGEVLFALNTKNAEITFNQHQPLGLKRDSGKPSLRPVHGFSQTEEPERAKT